jgi:hypothetical protein
MIDDSHSQPYSSTFIFICLNSQRQSTREVNLSNFSQNLIFGEVPGKVLPYDMIDLLKYCLCRQYAVNIVV